MVNAFQACVASDTGASIGALILDDNGIVLGCSGIDEVVRLRNPGSNRCGSGVQHGVADPASGAAWLFTGWRTRRLASGRA